MRRLIVWVRVHPWPLDLPLFVLFIALTPSAVPQVPRVIQLLPLAFVLPLLVRRRFPRLAATLVVIGVAVQYLDETWALANGCAELAMAVCLFNLVRRGDRRSAAVLAVVILGLDLLWTFAWGAVVEDAMTALVATIPLHVVAWALAEVFRAKEELHREESARAELAASTEQARQRVAVAEERARIARELHDVLAHTISVIVLNVEGAKLARHSDPEAVDRTLETIGHTGRSAMAELRRLLDVLHTGDQERSPQPTVTELRDLVERAGADGRRIGLAVSGEAGDLPASAALQAYRIVQEALTNMIRHAPAGATGQVDVDFGSATPGRRAVRIEVTNSGGRMAPAPARLPSCGRGLTGMAQRVELYHGTLDAGPTDDGGYRVLATLLVDAP